jgi:hypothetical protein
MTPEHDDLPLSPEGEQRKDEILREVSQRLPGIAARRRARRRAVRGSLAVALALTAGVVVVLTRSTPSNPVPTPAPIIAESPAPERPLIDFAVIHTSPVDPVMMYVRADTEVINAMVISDDELLRELAAMGRPAGLIRMNGQVRLSRDVTDPPL